MSIKYKIILSILLITFSIMSIISYTYIHSTQKNIKAISAQQFKSIGQITLNRIKGFLEENKEKVKLFNSNYSLQNNLLEYYQNSNKQITKNIKK